MPFAVRALALALLFGAPGIGSVASAATTAFDRVGVATWYGDELKGARTASGTPFDPGAVTAAHRTLPLNSYVEVTALDTGRTTLVLINDRGPGRRDREIDLSRRAAQILGIDRNPKALVRIRAVRPPADDMAAVRRGRVAAPRLAASPDLLNALRRYTPSGTGGSITATVPMQPVLDERSRYLVRVATFSNKARAAALADTLHGNVTGGKGLWQVQTGPFKGGRAVQRARDAAAARGYGDARILASD